MEVRVYVPALTIIESTVEPVLHEKLPFPEAYKVIESPEQIVVLPLAEIFTVGRGFTVIVCVAVCDPQLFIAVTV